MKLFGLLFCLLATSPLSPPFARAAGVPAIENGNELGAVAPLAHTVALLRFGTGGGFCSASFLSSRTLLTAGHCLSGVNPRAVSVNVLNPNGGWIRVTASATAVHPGYRNYKGTYGQTMIHNDLALVQLAQPFPVPVRTVELAAFPDDRAQEWYPVFDVGYGYEYAKGGGLVLRWGQMNGRLATINQFGNRVGIEQRVTNQNQNVCPGDSGGAVLFGGIQSRQIVAVHSLSNGCGSNPSTSASSELVWPARDWILGQVR